MQHPESNVATVGGSLSDAERRAYREDGFFVRAGQFDADEVIRLRDAAERAVEHALAISSHGRRYHLDNKLFIDCGASTLQFEHHPGATSVRVLEPVHLHDPEIDAWLDDERLAAPMRDLVDAPSLALWTVKLNTKRPREGSPFGWHQDSPYWIHDSPHVDRLPNVMLALDDQHSGNGGFAVIPGSHRTGILPGTDNGTQLGGFFTDPATFAVDTAVTMEVEAGSLIFFSPHCVHGSAANPSDQPRRAIIATYQPAGHPALKTGEVRNIRSPAA